LQSEGDIGQFKEQNRRIEAEKNRVPHDRKLHFYLPDLLAKNITFKRLSITIEGLSMAFKRLSIMK
jgi:hypothetical protein